MQDPVDFKFEDKHYIRNYMYPAASGTSKARLFFLHAYGDLSGRYGYFFKLFAEQDIEVFSFDMVGFGESGGAKRGIFTSESQPLDCAFQFIAAVEQKFGVSPKNFLIGQSMGGLLTLAAGMEQPDKFLGLTALVPYIELQEPLRT